MKIHTAGPWKLWKADSEHWYVCEPDKPGRHSHFANISVGNFWGDEGKANARLIAAAPDLLEALVPFVALCSSQETITITISTKDIQRARAAIAKATQP